MVSKFFQILFSPYFIQINILAIAGVIMFFRLPKEQRTRRYIWLPFLILVFTVFYENFAISTSANFEFNKSVNAFLGNIEFPRYNQWLYNVANKQVLTILYLFLIKSWLEHSKKKYINWMLIAFVVSSQIIQFSGIEPIYWFQPIIFTIGANMILVGSWLYFVGLMKNDAYLNSNPLRLTSFWQMTFILFTYSLTYINDVSKPYLVTYNYGLGISLSQTETVMGCFNLAILVLTIASPKLPKLFEKEPFYGTD